MAVLCPELSGREPEIRTLMTAFDAAGPRRVGALSGELVLEEAGYT